MQSDSDSVAPSDCTSDSELRCALFDSHDFLNSAAVKFVTSQMLTFEDANRYIEDSYNLSLPETVYDRIMNVVPPDTLPVELGNDADAEKDKECCEDFIVPCAGKKFRIQTKSVFITYPRCKWEPEELLKYFKSHIWGKDLVKYLIVKEAHKDGYPHLHAIVEYKSKKDSTTVSIFDIPVPPGHPNLGSVRKYPAAVRYLCKKNTPISNWDFKTYLKTQVKNSNLKADYTEINTHCIEKGVRSLVQHGMLSMGEYKKWKSSLNEFVADSETITPVDSFTLTFPEDYDTGEMLNIEFDFTDSCRRHPWLFGGTGTGKTYTAEHQSLPYYVIPKNNDWVGFRNQQVLVINEFKGEFSCGQLIDIMESRQQNIKGSSTQLPKVCLIITSNYSLRECYPDLAATNDPQLLALERRLSQIRFIEPHPACPVSAEYRIVGKKSRRGDTQTLRDGSKRFDSTTKI